MESRRATIAFWARPSRSASARDIAGASHLRVATKYPNITRRHFERQGIQAECVKLNGAMEIAPELGLAGRIVDLVSTGTTLRENGLVETSRIIDGHRAFFEAMDDPWAPL